MEILKVKYFKFYLIIVILLSICKISYSWERRSDSTLYICAGGGILNTNLTKPLYGDAFHLKYSSSFGIQAYLKPWQEFGFGTGIFFQEKRYRIDDIITYYNDINEAIGVAPSDYQLSYLSVPIKARYNFGKKFNVYIETGLQLNLLISGTQKAIFDNISDFTGNPDDYIYDTKENYRNFTISFIAGGGIEYFVRPNLGIFTEYTWISDMSRLYTSNNIVGNVKPKMQSNFLQIGVRMGIPIKYSVNKQHR
jgi:opacity protein-like surface antigen